MNDDDDIDVKGLDPHELHFIGELRKKRVCLFPRFTRRPHDVHITDFSHCLPFMGDCNALIFCAPRCGRKKAREDIRRYTAGANPALVFDLPKCQGLDDSLISDNHYIFERQQDNLLVWPPDANAAKPDDGQFWADFVILKIEGWREELHLLHLGLRGDHAWLYFLQPHFIRLHRLIAKP
jgi:hypothetical protein